MSRLHRKNETVKWRRGALAPLRDEGVAAPFKRFGLIPIACLRLSLFIATATGFAAPDENGFKPLFDGRTLAGWESHEGFSAARKETPGSKWWVEDGCLVGAPIAAGRGGFLWVNRTFRDFVFRTEVKLDYPIDSGIFLRCGPTGRSQQVMLDYLPTPYIGAIYVPFQGFVDRCPEGVRSWRENEWNDLEIRIEGEPARIRVWLNGKLITDFQHTAESTRGASPRGGIALQVHPYPGTDIPKSAGNTVRYRNIRIKELDSPAGT